MKIESVQFVVFLGESAVTKSAVAAGSGLFPNRFPNAFNEMGPSQSMATFVDTDYQVVLGSAPGRHDIIVSRAANDPRQRPLSIDVAKVRADYLDRIVDFARVTGAARLAIVINSNMPVTSAGDAVQMLRSATPSMDFPASTNEIDFKINVPKQFNAVPGLKMNRFHRWFTNGVVQIMIGGNGPRQGNVQWLFSEEIDVNSDVEGKLEISAIPVVLRELFDEAIHHIGKGSEAREELTDAA